MRLMFTLVLLALMGSRSVLGQGIACPDAGLFTQGGLVTKVCINCYFPIYIGGSVPIGPNPLRKPDDDSVNPVCICPGRIFGLPTPGIKMAMWQPTHMVEAVRLPFCSPALGGMLSGAAAGGVFGMAKLGGMEDASASNRDSQSSYLNFHYWKFPLSVITDMVTDAVCVAESASVDIDIAYISEIDPTWNNETLAMFTHPEAVLFANPVATAACMADAVASTAYKPIPGMFWCNGAHGHGYPFSGINRHEGGIDSSSSAAARALAAMHRRGIAKKTYGGAAVCRDHPYPTLPKQQYRLQVMFPIPEVIDNHWIGASPFSWRGGQFTIPGLGEDYLYLVWSWQACCMNL